MASTGVDGAEVLRKYCEVLVSNRSLIRDAQDLPYSKDVIKAALRHCIKLARDEKTLGYFKDAYISLAYFQKMSDDELKAVELMSHLDNAENLSEDQLKDFAFRISVSALDLDAMLEQQKLELSGLQQELAQITSEL